MVAENVGSFTKVVLVLALFSYAYNQIQMHVSHIIKNENNRARNLRQNALKQNQTQMTRL